jgi:hypothetical protein
LLATDFIKSCSEFRSSPTAKEEGMKSRKRKKQLRSSKWKYQYAVPALIKRLGLDRLNLGELEVILECGISVAVDLVEIEKAESAFDPYSALLSG